MVTAILMIFLRNNSYSLNGNGRNPLGELVGN